jgi:hypothetical protein
VNAAAGALLALAAAAALPPGPALKLGPRTRDDRPTILAIDSAGQVASRITCIRNQWVDPDDAAARLIASPQVAAMLVKKNARFIDVEELGPSKFDCVIIPPGENP